MTGGIQASRDGGATVDAAASRIGNISAGFLALRGGRRREHGFEHWVEGKMSDSDIAEDRGLPWRVAPWGDGSTPTGHANIISDKWGVVIASELLTETAEFIVATANMAPEIERLRAGRAAVWAECREACCAALQEYDRNCAHIQIIRALKETPDAD